MAKKPSVADDSFAFLNKIKVRDRFADKQIRHPSYGFCDTGSYAFNALLCGDLFGGFPLNRFIMVAGEQGSGKSYIGKNNFGAQLQKLGYYIFYYDTEGECTEEDLEEQNGFIPGQYRLIKEPTTVEEFFVSVNGIIDQLEEDRGDSIQLKYKVAIILDSQGNLSTNKAIDDATKGEIKQDMTKAKMLAGMYRSITNRCANLGIPMFITNHIYLDPGTMYGNPQKIAGGEGAKFSASIILSLHKTLAKEGKDGDVTGVVLRASVTKSRLVKQNLSCKIYLDYDQGLNKYYGLQELAENAGLVEKYSAEKFPDLVKPKEKNGRTTQKDCYVIKDPKKDSSEWFVGTVGMLTTRNGLGTILNEINEYVKTAYKFRPPKLRNDDEGVEIDEEEVKQAEKKNSAKAKAEKKILADDLENAISDDDK